MKNNNRMLPLKLNEQNRHCALERAAAPRPDSEVIKHFFMLNSAEYEVS